MEGDRIGDGSGPSTSREDAKEATDHTAANTLHSPKEVTIIDDSHIIESDCTLTKTLTRFDAFKLFTRNNKELPLAERINIVLNYFGDNYEISMSKEKLAPALSTFLTKSESMFKNCKHSMKYFAKKHQNWLNKVLFSAKLKVDPIYTNSPKTKIYMSLSKRQQIKSRRKLETLLEEQPQKKKVKAFTNTLSICGEGISKKASDDLETVIESCLVSNTAPSTILSKIRSHPQPYTPEAALAVVIDRKLTVETYNFLHADLEERGFPAFPPYYKVQAARKACYPNGIQISEREATVPFQSLLEHTLKRIFQINDDVLTQYCDQKSVNDIECIFQGQWGFDGSSGQSLYKQAFSDIEGGDENSLFATTFVPLQIITKKDQDSIWTNPAPQSYRFCRPLRAQYRKESSELILSEKQRVENEIQNLETLLVETSKGHKIKVNFELYFTAIDGKVLNIILNTNSQLRCPYCSLTSSNFNNLEVAFATPVNKEALKHGMSPLHAWIRVLEFLLRLAYKNVVKKWRILKNSEEGRQVEDRKKAIQNEVRNKLGLLVDVVRPNSGTTNDGNTARTALSDKNRQIFAEILELEKWLLDDLHVILIVLSSGFHIDPKKFDTYCKILAHKYVSSYGWHPMTVTIHKILVHGAEIIKSTALPIGMLSEQAAESRNKYWRHDREHHTRKMSREKTMSDLFNLALQSSDPVISSIRLSERRKKSKRIPLPAAAIALLKPAACIETTIEEEHELDFVNERVLLQVEDIF